MPITESSAVEKRKNEKNIALPDIHLTEEEQHFCQNLASQYVSHPASKEDIAIACKQLGRFPRGMVAVAARCHVCSTPIVVVTRPLLHRGVRHPTPFPTTFYVTSPQAVKAISRLEATGIMASFSKRLEQAGQDQDAPGSDRKLLAKMVRAHLLYCALRADLAKLLGDDISHIRTVGVGGMPTRVKCLHAMVGQALAMGKGVNPLGDWALAHIAGQFSLGICRCNPRIATMASPEISSPSRLEEKNMENEGKR